jgi:hypothetical protein
VVEAANTEGGGSGMRPGDSYPDGWHIVARRLEPNGEYNPSGEMISFYMTGHFECMVKPEDVTTATEIVRLYQLQKNMKPLYQPQCYHLIDPA